MNRRPMTVLQAHVEKWRRGCGSDQCASAGRVCLYRGKIPCDVLFIGEAPGESENVFGQPFVGPAGQLLDRIIVRSMFEAGFWEEDDHDVGRVTKRIALTNLVGCIPREESGGKAGEPDHDQIEACRPRLEEFIRVANPRLVVCVGSHARDSVMRRGCKHSVKLPEPEPTIVHVTHPAAILRMNAAQRGLEIQRCVVIVRSAAEKLS